MSLSVTLVPLALSVFFLTKEACRTVKEQLEDYRTQGVPCRLETKYSDKELLYKTLIEHGMHAEIIDENTIKAVCPGSFLEFSRADSSKPFDLLLNSNENTEKMQEDLAELDEEYGLNVQSYTYEKVKKNLEDNMMIEKEEILEDNSILLTINID